MTVADEQDAGDRSVLELRGVAKRFGGTAALSSVTMTLPRASTLALVGENGAGKSTLIKIISGVIKPDEGTVLVDGRPVSFSGPSEAASLGIATVYQELSLLPELTVAENLVLGRYPKRSGFISWREARRQAARDLADLGLTLPLNAPVSRLGLAEKYLIEIAKAVRHRPRVLILDEPTAALDPRDSDRIFALMDTLRAAGTSMIFVSHRLDELFRTAQVFTVLKDGSTTGSGRMTDTSEDDLVAKMLGYTSREDRVQAEQRYAQPPSTTATATQASRETVFSVDSLGTGAIHDISFSISPGEVVGIAGLRGSGQTELCRALTGVEPPSEGRMHLKGRAFAPKTPRQALAAGVGYLPQERKTQGLFLNMSVAQNIAVSRLVNRSLRWAGGRAQDGLAQQYRESLDIRLPGRRVDTPVAALSGGNQQKVVLARCLAADPAVLVLDEPTRGVDVGAKQQIHDLILALAGQGMAVIVSSSEIEELLGLTSRVLVLHRGELAGTVAGPSLTESNIVRLASGVVA